MSNLAPLMTSARTEEEDTRDRWETPLWLYEKLDDEFKFILDPAATEENALCQWFFDKAEDGLKSSWFGNVFVNPPYSQLKAWVGKGLHEATFNRKVQNVVMLIPARTDTAAWWDFIRHGEVRFLRGRLKFRLSEADRTILEAKNLDRLRAGKSALDPEGTSAPFPSAIVVFRGQGALNYAKTVYWDIRESKHAT